MLYELLGHLWQLSIYDRNQRLLRQSNHGLKRNPGGGVDRVQVFSAVSLSDAHDTLCGMSIGAFCFNVAYSAKSKGLKRFQF